MRLAIVGICLAALLLVPVTPCAQEDPPSQTGEAAEDIADGIQTFILVMEIAAAVGVAAAVITNVVYIATDDPMPIAAAIGTGLLGVTSVAVGAIIVEDEAALGGTLIGLGATAVATAIWAALIPPPQDEVLLPDAPTLQVVPGAHGAQLVTVGAHWRW